ncbi:DUF3618 domain-containing protein [Streptomyces sp. NPDC012888]|uniref:DUF3618 domain-containing protein n=1 Tax=Streptomyces sp. NPDC012888 TaxID=3364855 RepID=UPI0036BADC3F
MPTDDHGGSAVSDARTPAQIEADIVRRREQLAETLDEIGVRMHPKTIIGDAKAKVASHVDHTVGRAVATVNHLVGRVTGGLRDGAGSPRLERALPVAMLAVGVVGLLALSARRKRG